jgi:hypothetical protein
MKQVITGLFVILLFASCSWAQNEIPALGALAACGPANVNFNVKLDYQGQHLPAENSTKALAYFMQTQTEKAPGITAKVAVDGTWVGANHGDSYFFLTLEPGEHHLCAYWQSRIELVQQVTLNKFTPEAGKAYYFRIRITGGGREGSAFDLVAMNDDEEQFLVARSPYGISQSKK